MRYLLAYITVKDKEEGERLAGQLLQKRLVACVNISSEVESHYRWQGKLEKSTERVLLAKTTVEKQDAICAWVQKNHSYECPCIIFLPIEAGSEAFLNWIDSETKEKESEAP